MTGAWLLRARAAGGRPRTPRGRQRGAVTAAALLVAATVLAGCGGAGEPEGAELYETFASSTDATGLSEVLAQRYSPSARTLYIASSSGWSDALAGTPVTVGGALFMVDPRRPVELDVASEAEVRSIVIFGGQQAVPALVEAALARQFRNAVVERVAGAERYATAARLAQRSGPTDVAMIASGEDYPDALSAGAAAARRGAAVLLTERARMPSSTVQVLKTLGVEEVHVIGGEAAVGPGVMSQLEALGLDVSRVSGDDRYSTATQVAQRFFRGHDTQAFLADGASFQAAVITSSSAANVGAPLLLRPPDCTPSSVTEYLAASDMAWVESAVIGAADGASGQLEVPC